MFYKTKNGKLENRNSKKIDPLNRNFSPCCEVFFSSFLPMTRFLIRRVSSRPSRDSMFERFFPPVNVTIKSGSTRIRIFPLSLSLSPRPVTSVCLLPPRFPPSDPPLPSGEGDPCFLGTEVNSSAALLLCFFEVFGRRSRWSCLSDLCLSSSY